jgi:molybdenum cofactor sulfurtransferase
METSNGKHATENKTPIPNNLDEYNDYIASMRLTEYPMLKDSLYLDHAGTTLYSASLLSRFHSDMIANLYGNPHSASPSSQKSTQEIEDVRLRLLRFFNADPEHFDLVFTANTTTGVKLVADAFREMEGGIDYAYHIDSHTSLVGVREVAGETWCLDDCDFAGRIEGLGSRGLSERPLLLAYPAQSNMDGRRLPLRWCGDVQRLRRNARVYTLLDAAAYASTSPVDLSVVDECPDFTVLSLYKIFGFPDLGVLIVKKSAAHVFESRRYFGGGTVDIVVCMKEQWHAKKTGALHERLEDGTLQLHSIIALKSALQTHEELFGTLDHLSKHTADLAKRLYDGLSSLKHGNGEIACAVHKHAKSIYGDCNTQGPIVAFNLRDSKGNWVSNTEVEKLAAIKDIHLRTGGVCNPGGVAKALDLAPWEMRENFSAGHRCGSENDVLNGKPTGIIRLSLGAMSTRNDIERFLEFVDEFFVEKAAPMPEIPPHTALDHRRFHVESLTVYPIKSCGGWRIPQGQAWEIRSEGLAWDREWCLVHSATGKALSQKQYPRMALIRPRLDFGTGVLRITTLDGRGEVSVPLSKNPALYTSITRDSEANVCGDIVTTLTYGSDAIADFFTKAVGVSCTLARHNPASNVSRHSKPHLRPQNQRQPSKVTQPIQLSNESPILTISRSSLNRLNEQIKAKGGKAAHPSVFRANIVIAESPLLSPGQERPWNEDYWGSMRVGGSDGPLFDFLGGCRRCQMVCVDQESAEKNGEPFVTLAKTRRFDGRVLFGVHTALAADRRSYVAVEAGDMVETFGIDGEIEV